MGWPRRQTRGPVGQEVREQTLTQVAKRLPARVPRPCKGEEVGLPGTRRWENWASPAQSTHLDPPLTPSGKNSLQADQRPTRKARNRKTWRNTEGKSLATLDLVMISGRDAKGTGNRREDGQTGLTNIFFLHINKLGLLLNFPIDIIENNLQTLKFHRLWQPNSFKHPLSEKAQK